EQQKDEGDVEQFGIEAPSTLDQRCPHHGFEAFADHRLRRHVDQDGAKQRQPDADTAEDEILPRRLERLVGAVDADHQHRGQRRHLDCNPHQADIVSHQREVHREHQRLVHRMIEAHEARRQTANLDLVADIARAEHGGGEADQRGQRDEDLVEVVYQKILSGARLDEKHRHCGSERQKSGYDIDAGRHAIAGERCEQRRRRGRDQQHAGERIEGHCRSPRKRSSARTSTVSKRSRMRNRKMPMTMKAISTEKATLISTTSGMPLAPVAASTRPFSSDMKPTTWLTALRRVTFINSARSTTESAKARSSRASGSTLAVTRSITTIDSATSPMPSSMVGPVPTTVSISRWMPSRTIMRCKAVGITMALNTKAIVAVR